MNPNEIERALREESTITPSPDFTGRVMRAVRDRVAQQEALAFPWRRVLPGLIACVVLTLVSLFAIPIDSGARSSVQQAALAAAAAWLMMALTGSYALVWGALRFSGYRR